MTPSLNDVYIFAQIASAGGLIRGAKRLGLPKSTVSRRLAQLEIDVGAKLIARDARHFQLTDIGRAYAEHAQRVVETYAEAQDFLSQHDATPRGVLKVSMPADFAIFFLAEAIASFISAYPLVTLEIDASAHMVDLIGERFDLAIRIGKLPDSRLVAKPLTSLSRHFYASKALLKKHGTPKSLDELSALPFISLQTAAQSASTVAIALNSGAALTTFTPRSVIKTHSIGLMRALAIAGAGAALLPDVMAQNPLQRLLGDIEAQPAQVHFVMPQRLWLPAKTRAFIEHLQQFCTRSSL
jgi:DNA-binding transcriptional LysR family regulator